jgi:hypothetical protein
MYLARKIINGKIHYSIRQSYNDGEVFRSRVLFELGPDPEDYFVYPGGSSFYVAEHLIESLEPFVEGDVGDKLENLLWPFIDPEIRIKLEPFYRRQHQYQSAKITADELVSIERQIHIFDRRRLHYLRYGGLDQSRIWKMPPKIFRVLLNKSRDEREQYFTEQERCLEPSEFKLYIYVIFDLQRHFSELIARSMPQGLNQEFVDEHFLDDLCRLDRDVFFWAGMEPENKLHDYLIRYLILFFDFGYGASTFLDDYIRQFMNSHRKFSFPESKSTISMEEASNIFDLPAEDLKRMSKKQLTRLYRSKAKDLHPDTGGDHQTFVELSEAYEKLLMKVNG